MEETKIKCVFGYFVKDEFQGWRQDTFGTMGKKWAKIYTYSPKQVEVIKENTKQDLTMSGSSFMKKLFEIGTPINTEGQVLNKDIITKQVSSSEQEKRAWGEFELRVYEIPFGYDEYEEWKMDAFNNNLPEPLETHKFVTIKQEN